MVKRARQGEGDVRRGTRARAVLLAFVILAPFVVDAQAGRAAMDEGVRLMRANDAAKAEKQFEKAVAAEPTVGLYHLWLGRAVGQQASNASALRQPFLARRVKAEFERAVELDPTLLDARDGLISFYLQAPGIMGGSVEKAREQATEIARRDVVRGHLAASNIAWHGKDTVATERAIRAAIAAAPDSALYTIQLAQRQALWGRTAEAFATLDEFLGRHPTEIGVRFQVGRLAAISGERLPLGETLLRDLLTAPEWEPAPTRPSRAAVHFRLGMILEKTDRASDARASYEAALKRDPAFRLAKDALAALK